MSNCGFPEGVTHQHVEACYRAGRRDAFDLDGVYMEISAERARAHAKHGESSMESQPPDALMRLAILVEEVGEVAKEFNEGRHRGTGPDMSLLRKELIQTAAMATAWADAIGGAR